MTARIHPEHLSMQIALTPFSIQSSVTFHLALSEPHHLKISPHHLILAPSQASGVPKARHLPPSLQRPQGGSQGGGGGGGRGGGAGGLHGHHRLVEQVVQRDSEEPGELFGSQLIHGEGQLKPSSLKLVWLEQKQIAESIMSKFLLDGDGLKIM